MAQSPLAPPPGTKDPVLSRWLFLLWKRLTATGQILWSSIVPGTSADVAAVVTDETGSPGSLVFSGNPTLAGVTVSGLAYVGDTTAPAGVTVLSSLMSTDTAAGNNLVLRKCFTGANNPALVFLKSRGSAASPSVITSFDNLGGFSASGFDGTNYIASSSFVHTTEGTISTGVVPGVVSLRTANSSGTLVEAFRADSTQTVTLGGAYTAPALKVTPVASQARWVEVTGATSSGNPTIGTSAGSLAVSPAGLPSALFTSAASAVNYVELTGVATGSGVQVTAAGSDSNITMLLLSKGTGQLQLRTGGGLQVRVDDTASANRAITLTGSNGGNPTIGTSAGGLTIIPATGSAAILGSGNAIFQVFGSAGVGAVTVSGTSVAAVQLLNAGVEKARISADTTEALNLGTGSAGTLQVAVTHTASANRYITLTGSNGGNPKIGTNAGQLTLGTGAALATSATEGYVCIPTCAGAPTGVPAGAGAGNLPLIYDTTNNKLYAYNGAWKATAALT